MYAHHIQRTERSRRADRAQLRREAKRLPDPAALTWDLTQLSLFRPDDSPDWGDPPNQKATAIARLF